MLPRMYSLLTKCGTLFLAGYIAWLGWVNLGPRKPESGPVRQQMADHAVSEIAETLRQHRGQTKSVVLCHFNGDSTDYFTDALRDVLEQRGCLDLFDRKFSEKLRKQLSLRLPTCASPAEAAKAADSAGAEAALYGVLNTFESFPNAGKLNVEYGLVAADGTTIYHGSYQKEVSNDSLAPDFVRSAVEQIPWFKRGLGWLLAVLLLPVFTISFIRCMVRRQSNLRNAFVLAIYTLADIVLAYLLVGAALTGFLSVLFFILAVAAAFAYNVRIMTFALKLEE